MTSGAKKGSRKNRSGTLFEAPTESASSSLSSFSPDSSLFVHISLALDKHRLRLYNTATGRALAEHIFESGRATAISWVFSSAAATSVSLEPSTKKRRKQNNLEADVVSGPVSASSAPVTLLAIGLSNGSISLFSPTQGRVINTLSHPNSTSRILSLSPSPAEEGVLWTSNARGTLLAWHIPSNTLSHTLKSTFSSSISTSPCTAIAVRPSPYPNAPVNPNEANVHILAAHHTIRLVAPSSRAGADGPGGDVREIASFTGHASPVVALDWAPTSSSTSSKDAFVSIAEGDRFVSIWGVPSSSEEDKDEGLGEGSIMASIPLDTAVRSVSFSRPLPAHSSSSLTSTAATSVSTSSSLLAISVSGTLHVFPFPIPSKKSAFSPSKIPTAATEPSIKTIVTTPLDSAKIISATFVDIIDGDGASSGAGRALKIARLVSGVKPVFDIVRYLDQNGAYIPEIKLKAPPSTGAGADVDSAIQTKRYTEAQTLNVRSGHELPEGVGADDRMQYGELDSELAELSLGQRLAAPALTIKNDDPASASKRKGVAAAAADGSKQPDGDGALAIPMATDAISLTRTLTQALHSSDTRLLESVLAHSSQKLINTTVRRLPPQLAVPLLTACVERLNRGARAGTGKGRGDGSGASAQRGGLMVRWIRAVLVGHMAHLMTIPDLVTRLSGLHTTITSRLSLQERLLALNGRLDLVLSQIELRSSEAPASVSSVRSGIGASNLQTASTAPRAEGGRKSTREEGTAVKYVEGESDTDGDVDAGAASAQEGDEMDVDVDIDIGEDEGSVEDVELGGESGSDSQSGSEYGGEEDDDDEDEDQDNSDEDGTPRVNGFLDAEAEETWAEDESEESEEE